MPQDINKIPEWLTITADSATIKLSKIVKVNQIETDQLTMRSPTVRVALIKLAERTCAIRAVKNAPDEKRNRVARDHQAELVWRALREQRRTLAAGGQAQEAQGLAQPPGV